MELDRIAQLLGNSKKKTGKPKMNKNRLSELLNGAKKKPVAGPVTKENRIKPLPFLMALEGESPSDYLDRLYDNAGFFKICNSDTNIINNKGLKVNAKPTTPKNSKGYELGFGG